MKTNTNVKIVVTIPDDIVRKSQEAERGREFAGDVVILEWMKKMSKWTLLPRKSWMNWQTKFLNSVV
jgi:hypothetical protein